MKFLHIFEALFYGTLVLGLTADSYLPSDYSLSNSVISQAIAPYEEMFPVWVSEVWEDVNGEPLIWGEDTFLSPDQMDGPLIPENSTQTEDGTQEESYNFGYGDPVPESSAVALSYFENTVIIGDSRSQGLMLYGGLPAKGNLTGVALSVYNIWEKKYISSTQGDLTVFQALQRSDYDRAYIGLGINCVGYPSREKFVSLYGEFIDEVRRYQPEIEIYLQGIIPVNEPIIYSKGTSSYINNAVIEEFNALIAQVAKEKNCHYLDLFSYFVDDNGQLPEKASTDGLHFGSEYSKLWTEYLRTHTASFE